MAKTTDLRDAMSEMDNWVDNIESAIDEALDDAKTALNSDDIEEMKGYIEDVVSRLQDAIYQIR